MSGKMQNDLNCDDISQEYSFEQWARTSADQWHDYYGDASSMSIF